MKKQSSVKRVSVTLAWVLSILLACLVFVSCNDTPPSSVSPTTFDSAAVGSSTSSTESHTDSNSAANQPNTGLFTIDYINDAQSNPDKYGAPSAFQISDEVPVSADLLQLGAESDYLVDRIIEYFEMEEKHDSPIGGDFAPPGRILGIRKEEETEDREIAAFDVRNLPNKKLINGALTTAAMRKLSYSYGIFNRLIPEPWRSDIVTLYVIEGSNTAAFVNFDQKDDRKLLLGLNIDEMIVPNDSALDHYSLITLFLHEFAHVFSMDTDQALPGGPCFQPVGETFDCYAEDSYLNQFNKLFWSYVDPFYRENINKPEQTLEAFYELNQQNFLNSYSASNPYEDFAESFVAFVTEYAPTDQSDGISKKILFFYQYPELVELRAELLKTLVEIVDERILRGTE